MSAPSQRAILLTAAALALGYVGLRSDFDFPWHVHVSPTGEEEANTAALPGAGSPQRATFAGGCFWCIEADFDAVPGVIRTSSGYAGGRVESPSYEAVSRGGTGHVEAVEILYDPSVVTYEQLLDHFWRNIDPFAAHRQFCDVGDQYRPVLFAHSDLQRRLAEESRDAIQRRFSRPVSVDIVAAPTFYSAEAHHQGYARTHPIRYRYYRRTCGRDRRLAELWGR